MFCARRRSFKIYTCIPPLRGKSPPSPTGGLTSCLEFSLCYVTQQNRLCPNNVNSKNILVGSPETNTFVKMASGLPQVYRFITMLVILSILSLAPLSSCELVPAMFDPETKQVIYNPQAQSQLSGANKAKDLVVTIAQDVKMETNSRESKSESFGLNLGFEGKGLGLNYQKVKIREQSQQSHHQVNIAINIPGDCKEGCKEQADKVFQLANNALHSDTKQKRVN